MEEERKLEEIKEEANSDMTTVTITRDVMRYGLDFKLYFLLREIE